MKGEDVSEEMEEQCH